MLSTYDTWKTDPDYGKSLYQIELEEDMLADIMTHAEMLRADRERVTLHASRLYACLVSIVARDDDACHVPSGYDWEDMRLMVGALEKMDTVDTLKDEERMLSNVVL